VTVAERPPRPSGAGAGVLGRGRWVSWRSRSDLLDRQALVLALSGMVAGSRDGRGATSSTISRWLGGLEACCARAVTARAPGVLCTATGH